jgi:hypothetical protein
MLLKNWLAGLARKKSRLRRSTRRQRHGDVRPAVEWLEDRTLLNATPTLDPIGDRTIDEDSAEQTVSLAGISAGGGESQPLRVTTTSSANGLVPDPTVTYTSANATGDIAFTPVSDQSGTATITVTVEDGGLDNDLGTMPPSVVPSM